MLVCPGDTMATLIIRTDNLLEPEFICNTEWHEGKDTHEKEVLSARFERRETTLGLTISRSIWTRFALHERGLFFSFVHRTQQGLNAL